MVQPIQLVDHTVRNFILSALSIAAGSWMGLFVLPKLNGPLSRLCSRIPGPKALFTWCRKQAEERRRRAKLNRDLKDLFSRRAPNDERTKLLHR